MSNIVLRDYQERVEKDIHKIWDSGSREAVMAMCPRAGKTVTALHIAENTDGKVVILAHGQTMLKNQWLDRALGFEVDLKNIKITLPQSEKNKAIKPIELLIVDEAHQYYFKTMVQELIKKYKPKRILLLTGTPSVFVAAKTPMVTVSADMLMKENRLNNVYFSNVASTDKLLDKDFSKSGNLRPKFKHNHTKKDFNKLIGEILDRLGSGVTKNKPLMNKALKYVTVFKHLKKTMIACHSSKQAKEVYEDLVKQKVKTEISLAKLDKKSKAVDRFIKDDTIKVLIVIYRGILGFDFDKLVNIIDLTRSKNVNRIYQLFARVMTKDETNPDQLKYYFKLAPDNEILISEFYLKFALSLMFFKVITKYNGRNLNKIAIPKEFVNRTNKKGKKKKSPTGQTGTIKEDKDTIDTVNSLVEMIQIWNKSGKVFNEKSFITLDDIKRSLGNLHEDPEGNKKSILQLCEKVGRQLSESKEFPNEYKLACLARGYINRQGTGLHDEFIKKYNEYPKNIKHKGFVNFKKQDFIDVLTKCKSYKEFREEYGGAYKELRSKSYKNEILDIVGMSRLVHIDENMLRSHIKKNKIKESKQLTISMKNWINKNGYNYEDFNIKKTPPGNKQSTQRLMIVNLTTGRLYSHAGEFSKEFDVKPGLVREACKKGHNCRGQKVRYCNEKGEII